MTGAAESIAVNATVLSVLIASIGLILAILTWMKSDRIGPVFGVLTATFVLSMLVNPRVIVMISESLIVEWLSRSFWGDDGKESQGSDTPSSRSTPSSESSPAPTSEDSPSPEVTPSQSPEATPSSSPAPQVPESTTNWGEVWMIVGIIAVSLIVLIFAAWLTTTLVRRSRVKHREYMEAREKAKAEKERQEALRTRITEAWKETVSKHDKLDAEYLSYQKDLSLIARYPLMTDLAVPLTKKAVRAMTEARNRRPPLAPDQMDELDGYREAVTSFEIALRAAVSNAKREGLKNFSEREQKDLKQVQDLLRMAEDKAGSPHERRSAYERAIKTLQSILGEVPKEAILEIESRAKEEGIALAITA